MRAAQYLRMSTEHQQFSIENQMATINEYAKSRLPKPFLVREVTNRLVTLRI